VSDVRRTRRAGVREKAARASSFEGVPVEAGSLCSGQGEQGGGRDQAGFGVWRSCRASRRLNGPQISVSGRRNGISRTSAPYREPAARRSRGAKVFVDPGEWGRLPPVAPDLGHGPAKMVGHNTPSSVRDRLTKARRVPESGARRRGGSPGPRPIEKR